MDQDILVVSVRMMIISRVNPLMNLDPNTKAFLRKHLDPVFGYPSFVRFCWQTVKTILADKDAIECEW